MGGDIRFLINFYLTEFWKRRWIVVGVAWLVGLLGAFLVMSMPDRYESKAQLYVDTEALLLQVLKNDAATFDTERQIENVRQLMYSRPNLERVIKNTDLDLTVTDQMGMERLVARLQERLQVYRVGRDLYSVSYAADDPSVTQRVVQEVLNSFIEQNLMLEQTGTDKSRTFLASDLQKIEADLQEAENKLTEFRSQNVEILSDTSSLLSRLRDAESTVDQARIERSLLEARRDQLAVSLANTPPSLTSGGFVSAQAQQLAELRSQRAQMLQRLTPNHPDVKAIEQQIQGLEQSGVRTGGGGRTTQPNPVYVQLQDQMQAVELQIAQLDERVRQAQRTAGELRSTLERQPAVQQQFNQLQSNYQQLFDEFRKRRGDLSVIEMTEALKTRTTLVDYRVIEPPIEPVTPIGPNRLLMFLGVLFAAVGAGLAVAFLRIQMADNFPTLMHLRNAFEMPILGSVSMVRPARSLAQRLTSAAVWGASAAALVAVFGGLIYLYHFQLYRPDLTGLSDQLYFMFRSAI
ncbi:MAG: Wzz/FepE/Etk N-terminal domain-containing protein [Alphaproteobacteria bacterium]|nr:Wzz/FepE/Etk N-terminal domain-containing protein [Alphaproteobacteria bacterium]MDX5368690.1 Wzz/FepE/Etk N-terminal domain-containing protein [Alphaproteobacteria bacterium]MDX5463432.1 Wzz/FepE/Etk N-terminal domain-containing protein [Alphaproteobacteria bacterium]